VQSFPTFVYVQPETKGLKAMVFREERTYDAMKSWMVEIMGSPAPITPPQREEREEQQEQIYETDGN
jgi:hypothetical protein